MTLNLLCVVFLLSYMRISESYTYELNVYYFVKNNLENITSHSVRRRALVPGIGGGGPIIHVDDNAIPTTQTTTRSTEPDVNGSGSEITLYPTTAKTPTSASQMDNIFDCCDIPRMVDSSCDCTMIRFNEANNTCIMSCPDGCCDLRIYTPEVPVDGQSPDLLYTREDAIGCLDTCCLRNDSLLCCIEKVTDHINDADLVCASQSIQTTVVTTTTSQTQVAPNCCDLVHLYDAECNCRVVSFSLGECIMECPDKCCNTLRIETPDVPANQLQRINYVILAFVFIPYAYIMYSIILIRSR